MLTRFPAFACPTTDCLCGTIEALTTSVRTPFREHLLAEERYMSQELLRHWNIVAIGTLSTSLLYAYGEITV